MLQSKTQSIKLIKKSYIKFIQENLIEFLIQCIYLIYDSNLYTKSNLP